MTAEPDAMRLEVYRLEMAARLGFHKARVDRGLLMTPDSATVVPNSGRQGEIPFATFSADSREENFYAVAREAAKALVDYAAAHAPVSRPAAPDAGSGDEQLRSLADRVVAEVKRGASGSSVQALGALSNIEEMVLSALQPGGER